MTSNDLVSIIIPVYNSSKHIEEVLNCYRSGRRKECVV